MPKMAALTLPSTAKALATGANPYAGDEQYHAQVSHAGLVSQTVRPNRWRQYSKLLGLNHPTRPKVDLEVF